MRLLQNVFFTNLVLIVFLCGCSSVPEDDIVNLKRMIDEFMAPHSKEDFEEFYNFYREKYIPKRKRERSKDIPDFPLRGVEKDCKFPEKWKYSFLSGALRGWCDYYQGTWANPISNAAFTEGYYYGVDKALQRNILKRKSKP